MAAFTEEEMGLKRKSPTDLLLDAADTALIEAATTAIRNHYLDPSIRLGDAFRKLVAIHEDARTQAINTLLQP